MPIFILLMFIQLFAVSSVWAATNIGKVLQLEGSATLVNVQGKGRTLKIGDIIDEGDEIRTLADSHLQIHLQDDAYLALRPNSRLSLDHYRVVSTEDSSSIVFLRYLKVH
jgi:hypothetical protein